MMDKDKEINLHPLMTQVTLDTVIPPFSHFSSRLLQQPIYLYSLSLNMHGTLDIEHLIEFGTLEFWVETETQFHFRLSHIQKNVARKQGLISFPQGITSQIPESP